MMGSARKNRRADMRKKMMVNTLMKLPKKAQAVCSPAVVLSLE